jgi:hypothetical protein
MGPLTPAKASLKASYFWTKSRIKIRTETEGQPLAGPAKAGLKPD